MCVCHVFNNNMSFILRKTNDLMSRKVFEANDDSSLCREPDIVRRAHEMNDSVVRGRGVLKSIFAAFVPLAYKSPYYVRVYSVAN